jgi:serine/threonine-protein kinase mTOR
MGIKGSDHKDYHFLLKGIYFCVFAIRSVVLIMCAPGHEDLRQDERVMQLFSLVNNLLYEDVDCFKRRLHIQRFSVIPLAPQAGLLGWVNDSDTLHVLVKEYRDSRKVLIDIERRLMLQVSAQVRYAGNHLILN